MASLKSEAIFLLKLAKEKRLSAFFSALMLLRFMLSITSLSQIQSSILEIKKQVLYNINVGVR